MKRSTIKSAYTKIRANGEFRQKTISLLKKNNSAESIAEQPIRRKFPIIAVTLSIVLIFTIGLTVLFRSNIWAPHNAGVVTTSGGGVTLPKINPPSSNNAATSMIGLIVYKNKVYTDSRTYIDINSIKNFQGIKLGVAKGNIDEWSKKNEYSADFASNFSGDIYTVKGYDPNFRIMGIHTNPDGEKYVEIFEQLNGITIVSGKDVFGKLKMQGNTLSMIYAQSNDGLTPICPVNDDILINEFLDELDDSSPCLIEMIHGHIYGDWNKRDAKRNIIIKLKDGCNVGFTLVKGGYVLYGYCDAAFKISDSVFDELWNKLDISKDPSVKN